MREFDYSMLPGELLTPEIMNLISMIHEHRGSQAMLMGAKPRLLDAMLDIAKVESTGASNRIEGIQTSNERLEALVMRKAEPQNRPEQEITGYREALALIHENHAYMAPSVNVILQLHRDLTTYGMQPAGGRFKSADNRIEEMDASGKRSIRFQPLSALETPDAMHRLTKGLDDALRMEKLDPLLLGAMFILDFLCIHPFNDGNGRMSRLLTLLLLYRSGYEVGKYISIEQIIEQTKEAYYNALLESSIGWHDGKNDCLPFVQYYLEVLLRAYRTFSDRTEHMVSGSLSKSDRIRLLFEQTQRRLSKKEIHRICPDISISMIEMTLSVLLKEGCITKIGAGKNTEYFRKPD